jgi:hypothetical protein
MPKGFQVWVKENSINPKTNSGEKTNYDLFPSLLMATPNLHGFLFFF